MLRLPLLYLYSSWGQVATASSLSVQLYSCAISEGSQASVVILLFARELELLMIH
jgi:hypothetical protein